MYLKQLHDSCLLWDTAVQIRQLLFFAESHRVLCNVLFKKGQWLRASSLCLPATVDRTEICVLFTS